MEFIFRTIYFKNVALGVRFCLFVFSLAFSRGATPRKWIVFFLFLSLRMTSSTRPEGNESIEGDFQKTKWAGLRGRGGEHGGGH